MKPLPFRPRIALLSALISGVVLLAFGAVAWQAMYRERLAGLDRELRGLAYRHPGWLSNRANYEGLSQVIEYVFGEDRKERLILLVKDGAGETRYLSPHWPEQLDADSLELDLEEDPDADRVAGGTEELFNEPAQHAGPPHSSAATSDARRNPRGGRRAGMYRGGRGQLPAFSKKPRFETVRLRGASWRIGIMGHDEDRLVIGLDTADLQAELSRLRDTFLAALPIALLVVGWGGWWIAGRAVKPLRSIADTAERVTARGLDQRIPPSKEDPEIARTIRVLNGMMDRLEKSFHQATRFSADASHELRTPLAIMQGELENALQTAERGSREQQLLAGLLEESQRLKTITGSLLLLAQADAGRMPLELKPVNLSAELCDLTEDVEALASESQLTFELQAPPDIRIQADWPLLRQAILNLLNNAIRYNEPGGRLGIDLTAAKDAIELDVWNTGPGIPAEDQPRLFHRFFRVDSTRNRRVDGVGLGLSLAHEIVRAHGGDLRLVESRTGRTSFRLSLQPAGLK